MTTPKLLELTLMGMLGFAASCAPDAATTADTDEPEVCGEYPLLTPDQTSLGGPFEVCASADWPSADWNGECPTAEDLYVSGLLAEVLGPPPGPNWLGCFWVGEDVCGPTRSDAGECCYVMQVSSHCEGRPLMQDGVSIVAGVRAEEWGAPPTGLESLAALPEPTRDAGSALWTAAALAEHASIASFARATLELLGLGAPAELVADTARAQADEIRHAAAAFGIASAFAGAPVGPGPLPLEDVSLRRTPTQVLVALIVEGCVNETLAAAEAREAARLCTTPAIRSALHSIADDEARHAALAWRCLQWMAQAHPELRGVAGDALSTALDARPAIDGPDLDVDLAHTIGGLTPVERRELEAAVVHTVLRPLAATLFPRSEHTCQTV